jgi:CelD/BcsL family acetyltransferase involved in cellulose biosynthesis
VVTARTIEEAEALREPWEALQGAHVAAHPDHFLALLGGRPDFLRPHIVLLEREGQPRAMVVARVQEARLSTKAGRHDLYAPPVRSLTVVYGGFLGDASEQSGRVLLAELRRALARREADVLHLRSLVVGSVPHRLATTLPRFLCRQHFSAPARHWQLELPSSLDELLGTKSTRTRGNLRRYARRLTEEFGDRLVLDVVRDESGLDRLFRDTEVIAAKAYQRALATGTVFRGDALERELTLIAMRHGWFRGYILYLDGEPAAFWHGIGYGGVFTTGATGYDPVHRDRRVGTFLLMRMVEDLAADPSIDLLDFGFGDADYKELFGSRTIEEEDVRVYAPSLRAIRINLTRGAVVKVLEPAARLIGGRD